MADWKTGDMVRLTIEIRGEELPDGATGAWGWLSEVRKHDVTVRLAGASRPFDADYRTIFSCDPRHVIPFVRHQDDEVMILENVKHVLTRTSWTLPGAVERVGDTIVVARDRRREKTTFEMSSLLSAEVARFLGPGNVPNESGHAYMDALGIGRELKMEVFNDAFEARYDRRGSVVVRDMGLGTDHVVGGEAAMELVRIERNQPRYQADSSLAEALLATLPLPRTMRLDKRNGIVKVTDLDGDTIRVERGDETFVFDGKDGKRIRRAAERVYDIGSWVGNKLANFTPIEPSGPAP